MVYFLIGSSVLKSNEETWRRIQQESGVATTNGSNGSGRPLTVLFYIVIYAYADVQFEKEKFNMGNLDFLWYMENQLSKLDTQIESNLKKIEKQVEELDKTHKGFQIETREDGRSNSQHRAI